MEDLWQFPGEPISAGTLINYVFQAPGSLPVSMVAVGPNNGIVVTKIVTVAPASAIPTLNAIGLSLMLVTILALGLRSLG
jgi:hypothetical protein